MSKKTPAAAAHPKIVCALAAVDDDDDGLRNAWRQYRLMKQA